MGVIISIKKPNFTHKFSQPEYDSTLQNIKLRLDRIKSLLSEEINSVQKRMLDICIQKVTALFHHYFNIRTHKLDVEKNKQFKKYIMELKMFVRNAFHSTDEKKEGIERIIKNLIQKFISQLKYIETLETKIDENNITPFTTVVERVH